MNEIKQKRTHVSKAISIKKRKRKKCKKVWKKYCKRMFYVLATLEIWIIFFSE